MAEENIITNITAKADFSDLIKDLNRVTASLSSLQQTVGATNKAISSQIDAINRGFANTIRSTGQFSSHYVSLTSDVEKFGRSLDSGRLKLRDYYRVWQDHTRTSGGLIRDLSKQQVQLQNAILQPLGRNAQGLMQFNVHVPRGLDLIKNKTALTTQQLQIMNKVVQDGAVQLINWGKNTQWAGRQLTVGLTLPLAAFGKAAADAFRTADQELTRLAKVYGDIGGATATELTQIRKDVAATAQELASAMGVNFQETISLAADIAATGKTGNELLSSVSETTRLAVLGEVDRQEAMKATLAIQTAFKSNTQELTESINFLNAVENQTSTSLADLVEAIPKAGPVVKSLGGDIKDLALYLTAMREGGINASEAANAIKSGLASIINPTKQTVGVMSDFGIDILGMVQRNAGNTTSLLLDLQKALDQLDPLSKAQAIEQMFGKFQFARISALLNNLGRQGSQTLQVLDLMGASVGELEQVASRELAAVTESAAGRYRRALESLKADLALVGEEFLKIGTTILNVLGKVIDFGSKLPDPVKKLLAFGGAFTAIIGPVIMLTGVLANFFGYIVKGIFHFKNFFKGAEGWRLLTPEILAAQRAGSLAEQTFYSDAKAATILKKALADLGMEYDALAARLASGKIAVSPAISTMAGNVINPGAGGGYRPVNPNHPLVGGMASSHLNPRDPNNPATLFGLVPGSSAVNQRIGRTPQIMMSERLPDIEGLTTVKGVSTGVVAPEAARYQALMATIGMQSKQEIEALKETVRMGGAVSTDFIATFDDLVPITTQLSQNAAQQSALIVAEVKAGRLSVEQAKAQIIALNAQLERDLGTAVSAYATTAGRNIDLTKVPLIDQPVVDAAGKSNMRALFRRGRMRNVLSALGRATRTRTFGAPYSIETTNPPGFNSGGYVYTANDGSIVPGPNVDYDMIPAILTPGEFVVNKQATQENLPLLMEINNGYNLGGRVRRGTNNYGRLPSLTSYQRVLQSLHRSKGQVQTATRTSVADQMLANARTRQEQIALRRILFTRSGRHQDRAHIGSSVSEMIQMQTPYAMRGYFGVASANPYNKLQNLLHRNIRTRDINPVTDITAQNRTLPEIFKRMGAESFWKNLGAPNGTINRDAINGYLANLEGYVSGKSQWQSIPYGRIPRELVALLRSGKASTKDFTGYVNYLMSGNVKSTNKAGIIANDAAALMEVRKMSAKDAIAEAEKIYERALGSKNISDSQYRGQRLKLAQSEYSDFIAKAPMQSSARRRANMGGLIRGYNRGGRVGGGVVRRGRPNYGQFVGMPTMGPSNNWSGHENQMQTPGQRFSSLGGPMMAGFGMQMAGSMAGGQTGNALMLGGIAMQMSPLFGMLKGLTGGIKTFGSLGIAVFNGLKKVVLGFGSALKFLTGPIGLTITALTALTALYLNMKKNAEEAGKANRLAFGGTAESFASVGIKNYSTVNDRLQETAKAMELIRVKAQSISDTFTKAGPTGVTLSIKELDEAIKNAKENQKDYVEAFNNIDSSRVVQYASQLKAQFVAMGMSAEKASNQIFAIIKASGKASQAFSAVTSADFRAVKDQLSGINMLFNQMGRASNIAKFNAEEFVQGLNTLTSSVLAYRDSLIGKTVDGNELDEAEANKKVLEEISKIKSANKDMDQKVIQNLKQQDMVYATILGRAESLASITSKVMLYTAGVGNAVDLALLDAQTAVEMASNLAIVNQGLNTITESTDASLNPLSELANKISKAETAQSTLNNTVKSAKKVDEDYYKNKIKLIDKIIEKIQEEADERIKAIRKEQDARNVATDIQQEQLKYQQALMSGDMESAAQAQLEIQRLVKQKQEEDAIAAIQEKAAADIKKQKDEQERLAALEEARRKNLSRLQGQQESGAANLSELKSVRDRLESAVAPYVGMAYKDIPQFAKDAVTSILEEMKTSTNKDLREEYLRLAGKSGVPASQFNNPAAIAPSVLKGFLGAVEKKSGSDLVFKTAVEKFAAAVDKFGGTTGMPFRMPEEGEDKPLRFQRDSAYMLFNKDGKKIAVYGNTSNYKSIYDKAREKGWAWEGYSTEGINALGMSGKGPAGYTKTSINKIPGKYAGGKITGPGTGTSDSIPAYLSNGEFVINAASASKIGYPVLEKMNRYAGGGMVSYDVPRMSEGGMVKGNPFGQIFNVVNKPEIKVYAAEGQNAEEIARTVVKMVSKTQRDAMIKAGESINYGGRVI